MAARKFPKAPGSYLYGRVLAVVEATQGSDVPLAPRSDLQAWLDGKRRYGPGTVLRLLDEVLGRRKKHITLTLTEKDMGHIRRAFGSADDIDEPAQADASAAALAKLEKAWERGKDI